MTKEAVRKERLDLRGLDIWERIWKKIEHNRRLDGEDVVILLDRLLGIEGGTIKACAAEIIRLKSVKHYCKVCFQASDKDPLSERGIPMLLHCPLCSARHLDVGEFATKLHHTHACQSCGHCWRPAVVPTVGVQFLPGFKND